MSTPHDDVIAQVSDAKILFVIDDPIFDEHEPVGYHPERPERLGAARRGLETARGRGVVTKSVAAVEASHDDLARVHDEAYLDELARFDGRRGALDADTYVAPASVRAAKRGAGGVVALVDTLLDAPEHGARGLALLRPPGHHATRSQAMGFCLLNHAAVAAAHAVARGAGRVAVIDWDVHHGNGTQDIFWRDPNVLYLSLHQSPLYPGTGHVDDVGEGDGRGFTINVPLSPSATPAVYADAFEQVVLPVLETFAPSLVIVSAGFDAHERDPLAAMRLDDAAYGRMARSLARIADASAGGRMALLLEGGYDLAAIEGSLAASIDGMMRSSNDAPKAPSAHAESRHAAEITAARKVAQGTFRIP